MRIQPFVDDMMEAPRFLGLDAARGFLVLGIIFANMASLLTWRSSLEALGGQSILHSVLMAVFSGKFRCALYFIAGIAIAIQIRSSTPWYQVQFRYWWLILIGTVHGSFIWFGDILSTYGIAGAFFILIKGIPSRLPLVLLALFSISVLIGNAFVTWRLWQGDPVGNYIVFPVEGTSFDDRFQHYKMFLRTGLDLGAALPCMYFGMLYFEAKFMHSKRDLAICWLIVALASVAIFVLSNQMAQFNLWVAPLFGNDTTRMFAIEMNISEFIAIFAGPVFAILLINGFVFYRKALWVRALARAGQNSLSIYLMTSLIVTPFAYLVQSTHYRVQSEVELLGYGVVVLMVNLVFVRHWARAGRRGPFEQFLVNRAITKVSSS